MKGHRRELIEREPVAVGDGRADDDRRRHRHRGSGGGANPAGHQAPGPDSPPLELLRSHRGPPRLLAYVQILRWAP